MVALADASALVGDVSPISIISWHSGKLHRTARSSCDAETQAASLAEEESEYCRLVIADVLHNGCDLRNWQASCSLVPAALIIDCRGVYDALARSESSCLGLQGKRSAIEALALKRSMARTKSSLRWCHSAAQLGDFLTKPALRAAAPFEQLVQKGYHWRLLYDPEFTSARKRASQGLHPLEQIKPKVSYRDLVEAAKTSNAWAILECAVGPLALDTPGDLDFIELQGLKATARSVQLG